MRVESPPVSRMTQVVLNLPPQLLSILLTSFAPRAYAATPRNCTSAPDKFIGNSEKHLGIGGWMSRGICVRADGIDAICYSTLEYTLENLNSLRSGEYNGAAGVLALLPTIGALLGAPTTEIWRLLTVVPFGGCIAMALSFGGAILPVRVEDYENDMGNDKMTFGSIVSLRAKWNKTKEDANESDKKLNGLVKKIEARMRQDESQRLPKGHLALGLFGMVLLFLGSQTAMVIVEQGGVLPWWCISRWWMHLWYFLVTLTAIAENWAQLPFKETWKLFLSDIPYDVTIHNGDSIITMLEKPCDSINHGLQQLASLKAGIVTFHGSQQYTRPRNAVLIMVSVINNGDERLGSLLRLFSKCTSIATFVVGTAFFASVQLLALPIAVMALTLVLAAGVFSRAITGWIISGVNQTEPMLHVIVNSTEEAQLVIKRVLSLDEHTGFQVRDNEVRKIQVEIGGHVFVEQRRVAHRTPWHVRILGVLSEPFDLRKIDMSEFVHKGSKAESSPPDFELGLLQR